MEPSWPSKTEARRSKIDVEKASKFDQFLKASWNAIFSAQEAPRRASAADRRSGWNRPEATGGGFRRGKTRTSEKKNPEKEDGNTARWNLWVLSHTPTRDGRRIEAPLGGVPPPKVFGVRRVAIRKGVWKKNALKDLSFPEAVRTDFSSRLCPRQVLGFSALVLGKFLDFLGKVG